MSRFPYLVIIFCLSTVMLFFQNCSSLPEEKPDLRELSKLTPIIETDLAPVSNQTTFDVQFRNLNEDPYATYGCRINKGAAFDCSSGVVHIADLPDGDHFLEIKRVRSNSQRFIFRVDTTPPELIIHEKPAEVSGQTSSLIRFSAIDKTSGVLGYECSLNRKPYATCTSPLVLAGLTPGRYAIKIRAFDKAKNYSNIESAEWTVSQQEPAIAFTSKPSSFAAATSAILTFSSTAARQFVASFECRIDGGEFSPCTSPARLAQLSEGEHRYEVRAKDARRKTTAPLAINWIVDTMKPLVPVITSDVMNPSFDRNAKFTFLSREPSDNGSGVAVYECALDGGQLSRCTSPVTLRNLREGLRTFSVQAIDNAGNRSPIAIFNWTIGGPAGLE